MVFLYQSLSNFFCGLICERNISTYSCFSHVLSYPDFPLLPTAFSVYPTSQPSSMPSRQPTVPIPTLLPTPKPTLLPTPKPTLSPTLAPSIPPTFAPSTTTGPKRKYTMCSLLLPLFLHLLI